MRTPGRLPVTPDDRACDIVIKLPRALDRYLRHPGLLTAIACLGGLYAESRRPSTRPSAPTAFRAGVEDLPQLAHSPHETTTAARLSSMCV